MAEKNSSSSDISDRKLLAYLHGDADDELKKQIEQSETYQQRLQVLGHEMNYYTGELFRHDCPDTQLLGDYYNGLTSPSEITIVQAHLFDCPHCAREYVSYKKFLGEIETKTSFVEQIRILIARQLSKLDLKSGHIEPAFALRDIDISGKKKELAIFEDESGAGIQIILDFEDDQTGHSIATGYISGLETQQVKIDLWSKDNLIQTTVSDSENNFEFSGLSSGNYYLIIKCPELYLSTETFTI